MHVSPFESVRLHSFSLSSQGRKSRIAFHSKDANRAAIKYACHLSLQQFSLTLVQALVLGVSINTIINIKRSYYRPLTLQYVTGVRKVT